MRAHVGLVVACAALLCACSDDEHAPPSSVGPPPDAGTGCPPGTLPEADETCRTAGIGVDGCGAGFVHDGLDACVPVLPDAPCDAGMLAVPGEPRCHDVAPCGDGTWGDIPIESDTQHVDASYAGTSSDGSAANPYKTIQEGVDAAAPGAMVAIAGGIYAEDVLVAGSPVRLWGRCPSLVTIQGLAQSSAAVLLRGGSSGSELHALSATGMGTGVAVVEDIDVTLDQVWIHDTHGSGLLVWQAPEPGRARVARSLVDHAVGAAVTSIGGTVEVEASVLRDVARLNGQFGYGLYVALDARARTVGRAKLEGSLVERADHGGAGSVGAQLDIESSVLRDTGLADDALEHGGVVATSSGSRPLVTVRHAVLANNRRFGVLVSGGDATVEATVIRGTLANALGEDGIGAAVQLDPIDRSPAWLALDGSVLDGNHSIGISVVSAELSAAAVVVRETASRPADGRFGRGIGVEGTALGPARAGLLGCVLERNIEAGIVVTGADLDVERTLVVETKPREADQLVGTGVAAQRSEETGIRARIALRASRIERCHAAGMSVLDSEVTIEDSTILDTLARVADGGFGDGLALFRGGADVFGSEIRGNARAGIANFSGSVRVGDTTLACNAFDLDGESPSGAFSFEKIGDVRCGCAEDPIPCQVVSANLAPPEPFDP